jgi:hypothetical protein
MQFTRGTILAFDRGYTDYEWFMSLTEQGVYFVTLLKENADYDVVEKREVPQRRGVVRDEVVFFYKLARASQEAFFRRIEFYDEQHDRVLVFLTNHLELAAATVAAIYKERWQIEVFFRALKQSLRVKTFVGDFRQCLENAALDGADRHAGGEIPATAIDVRVVPFEFGGPSAAATVCLPRSVGLDRRSFPASAHTGRAARTVDLAAWLMGAKIWTAETSAASTSSAIALFRRRELRQHRAQTALANGQPALRARSQRVNCAAFLRLPSRVLSQFGQQ